MRTSNVTVLLNQGADFKVRFLVPGSDGLPINLTSYAFDGQMRETTDPDSDAVADFVFTILDQTVPANKGLVDWSLSKEDLELVMTSIVSAEGCRTPTPYLYDVNMTDSLGFVSRIMQGKVLVSPTVNYPVVTP